MRTLQTETLVHVALISPGHWLYSPACSYEAEAVKVTADSSVWALACWHRPRGQQTQVMHQQTIVQLRLHPLILHLYMPD